MYERPRRRVQFLVGTCLASCASVPPPTQQELAGADYGERPTEEEVLNGIRNWMTSNTFGLENPGSLKLRNLELQQNYISTSAGNVFGYLACFEWDAKQRLRGYSGYQIGGYLIKNGSAYDFDHDTNRSLSATLRCADLKENATTEP